MELIIAQVQYYLQKIRLLELTNGSLFFSSAVSNVVYSKHVKIDIIYIGVFHFADLNFNFQEENKTVPLPAAVVYHPTVIAVQDFVVENDVNTIKNNLGMD